MSSPESSASSTGIPGVPPELQPYLTLLAYTSPPCIPICIICQTAILPKSIPDHLRKQHSFPTSLRPILKSFLSSLPLETQALTLDSLKPLPHDSLPLKPLKLQTCYQCTHCTNYIRKDISDVRKHINTSHSKSAKDGIEEIEAQAWFGGRWKGNGYWKVDVGRVDVEGPACVWGLFGSGWGDKLPRYWPEVEAGEEFEREVKRMEEEHLARRLW